MADAKPRKDSENLAKLEKLRPLFEQLKEGKVRNASDVERFEREALAAKQAALDEIGTSDLDEIRAMIQEKRATNTSDVDDFEARLLSVKQMVDSLNQA